MSSTEKQLKDGLEIRNIRRGKGPRNGTIYADLYINDELVFCATLDYILKAIESNRQDLLK